MKVYAVVGAALAAMVSLSAVAADPPGEPPAKVTQVCAACHGANGVSTSPIFPSLAGQYKDYIEQALREYQDNERYNPIMTPMAKPLTSQQIAAVASWYSQQKPVLYTPDIVEPFVPRGE